MNLKVKTGDKEMVMAGGMVMEIRISREGPQESQLLKLKHTIPPQKGGSSFETYHLGGLVVVREMAMEMVGIGVTKIENDIDTKYDLNEKDEEESDTEDSFKFEITPHQLSQVTPSGGVRTKVNPY